MVILAVAFTQVGGKYLYLDPNKMNYAQAQERCRALDSSVVEIWSEQEWIEVITYFTGHRYHTSTYRDELKGMPIVLSTTQAGPGKTVKLEQEEISPNHVKAF